MRVRKQLTAALLAVTAFGCADSAAVSGPDGSGPQFTISDGVTNGGNPRFFFLEPIRRNPVVPGVFDANRSPTVIICEMDGPVCTGTPLAEYTMNSGTGGETIVLDDIGERYRVKWKTKDFDLVAGVSYRIVVVEQGLVMGYADVDVLEKANGKEFTHHQTGENVVVDENFNLSINFRIEQGIFPLLASVQSGNNQSALPGETLADPVIVAVTDASGFPAAGIAVQFQATGGGGTLSPAIVMTDVSGHAEATWVLGPTSGANTGIALSDNVPGGQLVLSALAIGNFWTGLTSMPTSRQWVSVTAAGGLMYAAGGYNGTDRTELEAYDPVTDTWTTLAQMPEPRYAGVGIQEISGRLYMAGGFKLATWPGTSSTLFVYDIGSNTWTSGASLPHPAGCGGTGVIDDQLYVITGCTSSSGYTALLTRYDPGSDTWVSLPPPPNMHVYPAVGVIDGKLYVAGGAQDLLNTTSSTMDVYDPVSNSWAAAAPMPGPRMSATAQVVGGRLYLMGGQSPFAQGPVVATDVYDPNTDSWSTVAGIPTPRWDSGSAAIDGQIYVVGGTDDFVSFFATLEAYLP